ncbi:MAG: hypothetical protein QF632_01695 [Candidatus Woesearchaeota archaeon]|jgi:hypothetical protein|nr:hypothetical protein [Candidatus Woesearchaeota archaeon]MDP7323455.1 hypothetical protein [Candidatus Woesearchaeota archaeon]MDP7457261.1 hypothetical protein [Candidatus Woesearchaeota archaeon]
MKALLPIFGSKLKVMEILALLEDAKPVVRQGFYANELPNVIAFCEQHKLHILTSAWKVAVADHRAEFSNKGVRVPLSDPSNGMLFVYISKESEKAAYAKLSEDQQNHYHLGLSLGYPECCCKFFIHYEPERAQLDNNYEEPVLQNSPNDQYPYLNNIFLRHNDLALISHFPCNLGCGPSQQIAHKNQEIFTKYDPEGVQAVIAGLKGTHTIHSRVITFD